ncbi:hypothetical protein [Mucilaginibacter conchicola]|nr:hypothetical protein [Mucilaginibacter conchicola]
MRVITINPRNEHEEEAIAAFLRENDYDFNIGETSAPEQEKPFDAQEYQRKVHEQRERGGPQKIF